MFVLESKVIRFFELTEDFRFAQKHRIDAAGDFEQVFQAVRFGIEIHLTLQRFMIAAAFGEIRANVLEGFAVVGRCYRVKLHAVAGRDDNPLRYQSAAPQVMQSAWNFRFFESEPFPHVHGAGAMAEAYGDDRHATVDVLEKAG